jgi:MFS family permease
MALPNCQSTLLKLKIIRMLFWMHFYSAVLVPFYTQWGNLKLSEVFFLNAWFMFWNFVLEIPTGAIADYLGRKTSLIVGYVFGIVAVLVYTSQPSILIFLVAEFIFAIAYTLHSGADESLAYDSLKEAGETSNAKKVLSQMEAFKLAGIMFSAPIGSLIAQKLGLAAPMRFYIGPCLIGILIALSLREPSSALREKKESYLRILREGTRFFLQHKILLILTLELAIGNAMAWAIIWLFQPALEKAGMPMAYFGFVIVGYCLGQILFLSQINRAEKIVHSKRHLLWVGSLIAGSGYIFLGTTDFLPAVVVGIIIVFTFGLTRVPIFNAYMHKYIPSEHRATVLSVSSMIRTLSIVIMNPLIGVLADWSLPNTFYILGASLLILPAFSRIKEAHLLD